ncbi:NAD(P)/FAD-dependent oxidoreductase [Streptomyces sp. NBC_00986]|uniref:NAD(P)/FAD-dependent oxidoreductase n=1 Tax=Streptomyces sp. NBC_00986 TaxID=2903702 RepID=UPI00386FB495|nr:FAD-dependent oxidoreductase [Streptomyces sp. NBC_00986]
MTRQEREVDVLVVGAGPAGLAAAARLAAAGVARVEVLDREQCAGGVPRHCHHGGFGTWTHPLNGPAYARLVLDAAERAGAVVRTGVTALDWAGPLALDTVGPQGPEIVRASAVVLATGARERPRAARLVPGTRPNGVYTTGELQQAVHLYGQRIGTRVVVVGAEDVSYAAAETVRAAGAEVVAMVTELPVSQATATRTHTARLRHRIPLLTDTTVTELLGHGRLSGVRVRHRDGRSVQLACDTVVFTGDFVPDHELARRGRLDLDPGTRGPAVDGALHTSRPGVFAAGSVLHPVESAATATRDGAHVAAGVLESLACAEWSRPTVPLLVEPPLRWIAPNRVAPGDDHPYVLRTSALVNRPVLQVVQDGRLLHKEWLGTAVPNRTLTLTAEWTRLVDVTGGSVRVTLTER